jgi:hypothetical protein
LGTATSLSVGEVTAPHLELFLNPNSGEWNGAYYVAGVRRLLRGAALNLPNLRGRGWIEIGVSPNISTSRWEIDLAQ